MNDRLNPKLARRDLFRVLAAGIGVAAVVSAARLTSAAADSFEDEQKTKPRYRVTKDVEAFYRVNRY